MMYPTILPILVSNHIIIISLKIYNFGIQIQFRQIKVLNNCHIEILKRQIEYCSRQLRAAVEKLNVSVANLSSVVTESNFPYANMAFIHGKLNRVVAILKLVFPEINLKRYTITFIYFYAYIINMNIF